MPKRVSSVEEKQEMLRLSTKEELRAFLESHPHLTRRYIAYIRTKFKKLGAEVTPINMEGIETFNALLPYIEKAAGNIAKACREYTRDNGGNWESVDHLYHTILRRNPELAPIITQTKGSIIAGKIDTERTTRHTIVTEALQSLHNNIMVYFGWISSIS